MPKKRPLSNIKLFRNYLYGDVDLGESGKMTVRVPISRRDVSEALTGLHDILLAEAGDILDKQAKPTVDAAAVAARATLASHVLSQIRRGITPDELERSLTPMARGAAR